MLSSSRWTNQSTKVTERITLPVRILEPNSNQPVILQRLQEKLERIPGIEKVFVSPTTEMVYLVYDPEVVNLNTIKQKLDWLETELVQQ
jgi:copper chaperone CopZ